MIEVKVCHVTRKPFVLFGVSSVKATRYTPTSKIVNLKYQRVDSENVIFDGENVVFDGEQVIA
jgi:hypothetical protein